MIADLADIPVNEEMLFNTAVIDLSSGRSKYYTFYDVNKRIDQIASALVKKSFDPESRIAIIGDNSFNYLTTYIGIRRAGLTPVLINTKLSSEQVFKILLHSDSEYIFYEEQFRDKIPSGFSTVSFDTDLDNFLCDDPYVSLSTNLKRPAFFLYTSGSTGEPKGVVVSTESRKWLIKNFFNRAPGRRVLLAAPMYHMNGLSNLETTIVNRSTLVILPSFDPIEYIKAIQNHRVNMLTAVPPMMAMVLQHEELLDKTVLNSVNGIVLASAPTSQQLYHKIKNRFKNANLVIRYGLTEVGPALFGNHPTMKTPEMSVGYPRQGIQYKLIDNVLFVKSPSMLTTYHKNSTKFAMSITEDGFFNTKDKFTVDENGFYFFEGRSDDMFVSGGENIYPSEVEDIIENHPEVYQAAVVGLPDEIKGTKPYAFVVKTQNSNASEEDIKQFVLKNAPPYQHPRRVWFLDQMPLTGTNKINKLELEELAKNHLSQS